MRRALPAFWVGLLAMLLAVGLVPRPASADIYPPAGLRVVAGTVSPASLPDGGTVRFSGTGFGPGQAVQLAIDGLKLGSLHAEASGAFSVSLVLHGQGSKALAASGLEPGGRLRVVSSTVTLTSAARVPAVGGGLPFTGAHGVLPSLLSGLALVILGAGVTFLARRRRRSLRRPVARA